MIVTDANDCGDALGVIELFRSERMVVLPLALEALERHSNGKVVNPRWVLDSFKEAERLAEVPHIEGRAAYGLRRAAVDAAKEAGISREGLQAHGGWTDSQIPDRVYADQQAGYAREEARRVRAKIRGEE